MLSTGKPAHFVPRASRLEISGIQSRQASNGEGRRYFFLRISLKDPNAFLIRLELRHVDPEFVLTVGKDYRQFAGATSLGESIDLQGEFTMCTIRHVSPFRIVAPGRGWADW